MNIDWLVVKLHILEQGVESSLGGAILSKKKKSLGGDKGTFFLTPLQYTKMIHQDMIFIPILGFFLMPFLP